MNTKLLMVVAVLLFLVCGLTFLLYVFVPSVYEFKNLYLGNEKKPTNGIIMVTFKPDVPEKDVRVLIKKYKLEAPEDLFRYKHISFYSEKKESAEDVRKLKQNSLISKTETMGNSVAKTLISVDFVRPVSREEIDSIVKQLNNFYLEKDIYDLDAQKIMVPKGKEEYYSEIFNKESIVKESTTVGGLTPLSL